MLSTPRLFILITILVATTSCEEREGLSLAPEWQVETVVTWKDELPDMLAFSKDGNTLFVSCETRANMLSPSLVRIDLKTGRKQTLLYGLDRADGLKMDQHGDLWLGEEVPDGLIVHIASPAQIAPEQRLDRERLRAGHDYITPIPAAGRFSHEGLAFSQNGEYLYLADEWSEGCLYRLTLAERKLEVLHPQEGWLKIATPIDARLRAEILHGRYFDRLEDMELLPDGRILMAETGSTGKNGRIWMLDDRGTKPTLTPYLENAKIQHPDNLEWDEERKLLWISDDSSPSVLWTWNGKQLTEVASHRLAEITGIESAPDGSIYFNLQHNAFGPDATLRIRNGK